MLVVPLPLAAQDAGEQELARRITEIVNQQDAARGFWGIEVYAPQRGRTLYVLNADHYFTPASVTKLFTTAAALSLLGLDYRFRTVVGTRGRIERDGRLAGNLFFVGGGDPDLAGCDLPYDPARKRDEQVCDPGPALDDLAAQVAAKGVQLISGDLVVDQSFFAPDPYGLDWSVGDLVWSYGAPVRALSLADNVLSVRVEPGEQMNQPGRLTWLPFTRFYQIENRVWTSPPDSETQLYVRRDPGSRVLEISGPIALNHKGRTLWVAIEEPSEFAGELFQQALERRGLRLQGRVDVRYAPAPPFAAEPPGALPVILAEHLSLALIEEVKLINKSSQNLHAEMLLRLLGRQLPASSLSERPRKPNEPPPRRGDGSAEAGLEVLRAWLANAGVNPDEVALRDGSGLARAGLVTPRAVVKLLNYAAEQPWGELYRDTLPVGGLDGTLKERMRDSPARARIRAKTGTLTDANALAGYVETQAGESLVFAIFVNHHRLSDPRVLELMDSIGAALVDLPPPAKNHKTKTETRK